MTRKVLGLAVVAILAVPQKGEGGPSDCRLCWEDWVGDNPCSIAAGPQNYKHQDNLSEGHWHIIPVSNIHSTLLCGSCEVYQHPGPYPNDECGDTQIAANEYKAAKRELDRGKTLEVADYENAVYDAKRGFVLFTGCNDHVVASLRVEPGQVSSAL